MQARRNHVQRAISKCRRRHHVSHGSGFPIPFFVWPIPDPLVSLETRDEMPSSNAHSRSRVHTWKRELYFWIHRCRLGWWHLLKTKYMRLCVHDERRMHQLKKAETTDSRAIFNGSRIHGTVRNNQRSSMDQVFSWWDGKWRSHQDVRRQPRINRSRQEPRVSWENQAYWHTLSFCARESGNG